MLPCSRGLRPRLARAQLRGKRRVTYMIYLGADHGGFDLKEKMKRWLNARGYAFEDLGNTIYDKDDDYPMYAVLVGEKVAAESGKNNPITQYSTNNPINESNKTIEQWSNQPKGILACRSAAGVVIAANKVIGIRAAAVTNAEMAKHARGHNDANVIGLSGDWINEHHLGDILEAFLATEFSSEQRHTRRLAQIAAYEKERKNSLS